MNSESVKAGSRKGEFLEGKMNLNLQNPVDRKEMIHIYIYILFFFEDTGLERNCHLNNLCQK